MTWTSNFLSSRLQIVDDNLGIQYGPTAGAGWGIGLGARAVNPGEVVTFDYAVLGVGTGGNPGIGVATEAVTLDDFLGNDANGWCYFSGGNVWNNGADLNAGTPVGVGIAAGDHCYIVLDRTANTAIVYINGAPAYTFTGLPATGVLRFAYTSDVLVTATVGAARTLREAAWSLQRRSTLIGVGNGLLNAFHRTASGDGTILTEAAVLPGQDRTLAFYFSGTGYGSPTGGNPGIGFGTDSTDLNNILGNDTESWGYFRTGFVWHNGSIGDVGPDINSGSTWYVRINRVTNEGQIYEGATLHHTFTGLPTTGVLRFGYSSTGSGPIVQTVYQNAPDIPAGSEEFGDIARWNPITSHSLLEHSNGSKTVTKTTPTPVTDTWQSGRLNIPKGDGKWIFGVKFSQVGAALNPNITGVAVASAPNDAWWSSAEGWGYYGTGTIWNNGGNTSFGTTFNVNDEVYTAVDISGTNISIWFGRRIGGTGAIVWQGTGSPDPATGTSPAFTSTTLSGPVQPMGGNFDINDGTTLIANAEEVNVVLPNGFSIWNATDTSFGFNYDVSWDHFTPIAFNYDVSWDHFNPITINYDVAWAGGIGFNYDVSWDHSTLVTAPLGLNYDVTWNHSDPPALAVNYDVNWGHFDPSAGNPIGFNYNVPWNHGTITAPLGLNYDVTWSHSNDTPIGVSYDVIWDSLDDSFVNQSGDLQGGTSASLPLARGGVTGAPGAASGANAQPIELINVRLIAEEGSPYWQGEADILDVTRYQALAIGNDIEIDFYGKIWRLVIDGRRVRRGIAVVEGHPQDSVFITALSPIVRATTRYTAAISREYPNDQDAKSIVEDLLGVSVDWRTINWTITGGRFEAVREAPLTAARKITEAVGAYIESNPDGTLYVRSAFPVPVVQWLNATPDFRLGGSEIYTTDENLQADNYFNCIEVSDGDANVNDLIEFIVDPNDPCAGTIRIYPIPWRELYLQTSRNGITINGRQHVTRTETATDIEFVEGRASLQYPPLSVQTVTYKDVDLGNVTFDQTDLTSTVEGWSLADVAYTTRSINYDVRADEGKKAQFLLVEDFTGASNTGGGGTIGGIF